MRAEGLGGANESRRAGRSRLIGCFSPDGRWFERAPNTSVIDDMYATYIHVHLMPSHAFARSFSINTYQIHIKGLNSLNSKDETTRP